jgi:hypothetical protein
LPCQYRQSSDSPAGRFVLWLLFTSGCRLPAFWLLGPIHLILLPEMNGQAMSV